MTESAIKANSSEAQQLYQRGVAAARGGQRRVAAGLLTRSVQLDPQSERAWLWLSGVLDDPEQVAFCLHAVLKLNPQNQHALKGLERLAARGYSTQARQPAPGLQLPSANVEPAPQARNGREAAHSEGDSWWVHWRRNRRETSRVRLLLWTMPLILVCLALVLYESFALAVDQAQTAAASASVALVDAGATPPEEVEPAPFFAVADPIMEAEPLAVVEGLTVAYLGAIEPMRAELRTATEAYRQATSQPGGASVSYVAATQRLRATVEQALATMEELRPPGTLQQAHDDYQRGLELELAGLDAVLSFYSSYDVANANRAAMHFQQARAYIERASGAFATQRQQLAELSAMSAQTAR